MANTQDLLYSLPPELRNTIYEYLIPNVARPTYSTAGIVTPLLAELPVRRIPPCTPALACSSRYLRSEYLPVAQAERYATHTFQLDLRQSRVISVLRLGQLVDWLEAIGGHARPLVRCIMICAREEEYQRHSTAALFMAAYEGLLESTNVTGFHLRWGGEIFPNTAPVANYRRFREIKYYVCWIAEGNDTRDIEERSERVAINHLGLGHASWYARIREGRDDDQDEDNEDDEEQDEEKDEDEVGEEDEEEVDEEQDEEKDDEAEEEAEEEEGEEEGEADDDNGSIRAAVALFGRNDQ
ncbi:hypothetical protein LTR56_022189 [Elasticomyces elasticus]|nr:hypothetical protein LTR56_022189 [Elasticomyces elasticus]KAK4909510.1 hypothetical protein LTR49_021730 [Elasticomyces elasticus]KAK5748757.1 hypothetical protein LTS12_021198 [Elasticomyces elasticus]